MELGFKLKIDFNFHASHRGLVKEVEDRTYVPGVSAWTVRMESLPALGIIARKGLRAMTLSLDALYPFYVSVLSLYNTETRCIPTDLVSV